MKRKAVFFLFILVLILAACSGPSATPDPVPPTITANSGEDNENSLQQADQQGAVTVTVTPINLGDPGETLDFDVSMETHSVDLSMNLTALSDLQTDTGAAVRAVAWDGPQGGHHVKGKLSFPASQDGKSILQGAKTLTLTIQKVDAPVRTFTWDIAQ